MINQTIESGATELVVVQKANVLEIYTSNDGLTPIIDEARTVVSQFEPDLSTATSRKKIASLARRVATLKTTLDGYGKELVSEWKKKSKLVDDNRRNMRIALDALKEEARQPLTDWENAEIERITTIKRRIERITNAAEQYRILDGNPDLEKMKGTQNALENCIIDDSFGEFATEAATAHSSSLTQLIKMIQNEEERLLNEAELQRLKAAEEERQKIEEEKKRKAYERELVKNAKAKAEAEKKAAIQREQEAIKQAKEQERLAIIAKEEAKVAAERAEARRLADLAQAEKDKKEAVERARIEQINKLKEEKLKEEAARKAKQEESRHDVLVLSKDTISMLLKLESNFETRRSYDPEREEEDEPCYAYGIGIIQGKAELARELLTPILNYRKKA